MKIRFCIATVLMIPLFVAEMGITAEIPRDPLDRLWEEHMLTGTPAYYFNGERRRDIEPIKTEKGRGSPWFAERPIIVQDFRGTTLLGLLQGGGWSIKGGLLGKVDHGSTMLELYVKNIQRSHPGLFDNYYRPKEEGIYEFFLLQRKKGGSHAVILKKWVIRPEQVRWFVPERIRELFPSNERVLRQSETSDVRGFLSYDPTTKIGTVTIRGLKRPFEESVDLSKVLVK